jgi:hypothetical protein
LVITRQTQSQSGGTIGLQYYNGFGWQNQFHQVRATLSAANTSLTSWTYEFNPGGNSEYRIDVTARVYDRTGQFQAEVLRRSLRVETEAVGTAITRPVAAQSVAGRNRPLELRGWTKAESPIREVRLVIRDLDSGQYFDGQTWQFGFRFIPAAVTSPADPTYATWSYTMPSPGQFRRIVVTARGYQTNGVFDTTVATARVDLM